jgi:hypothetical protein
MIINYYSHLVEDEEAVVKLKEAGNLGPLDNEEDLMENHPTEYCYMI